MAEPGPTDDKVFNTAMGMTSAERDVRERLKVWVKLQDDFGVTLELGVVRTLIRDLDMWRGIVCEDYTKLSFDALVQLAKLILDKVYPADVFTGESGDDGPTLVAALRNAVVAIEAGKLREAPDLDVPRLGDSAMDVTIVGRLINEHLHVTKQGDSVSVGGITEAARAVIELIRQNRGTA